MVLEYMTMENNNDNFIMISGQESRYGGNQQWWEKKNETIAKYGCGVIAMCNIELYLKKNIVKMHGLNNSFTADNEIHIDDYTEYVNERYINRYHFISFPPFSWLGLMPWTMKAGLKKFFKEEKANVKIKWAPTLNKGQIMSYVTSMLDNDIPISASYYVFNKKNTLNFYVYDDSKKTMIKASGCSSHYFNITGIKDVAENMETTKYFIISSWGKKYYIKVNEWIEKLSYFSNILFVKVLG